ncbi:amphi-Trp domain-containing protein [Micromonospora sp. WMMD812]|uniref:amphi-Trp domain-containing protein n=1 Tax=Micromonospora sp. WMMD812 TaxID=3015152 RepID=UPI00248C557C|nr:amphi-Trp domain-containing protein [Micromonospora sp. WMMD812]WBB70149.1 amphi-Trp domain-containing protein [Micromonospora sp. WMMD812]
MDIYEDARAVSRADLAAWLRQLANQLESDGKIFYGAAGAVAVADQVTCELEIERDGDAEISVEIEFSWTESAPPAPAAPTSSTVSTSSASSSAVPAEEDAVGGEAAGDK